MVFFAAIFACKALIGPADLGEAPVSRGTDAGSSAVSQWPVAGDSAWVEVSARVDEQGKAGMWMATAAPGPVTGAGSPGRNDDPSACRRTTGSAAAGEWLAGVALDAPAPGTLTPGPDGKLWTGGPLRPSAAAWDVGDVKLLRRDGTSVMLKSALRFGQAAEVTAIRADTDGNLEIELLPERDQHVEIATTTRGGEAVTCPAVRSVVRLPWWAVPDEGAKVLVRAVRETQAVVPNEGMYRVRGVVEQVLELAPGRVSERFNTQPPPGRPSWEPRKILRLRANLG